MTISEAKLKIDVININTVLNDPILLPQLRELTLHSRSGMNHELNAFQKIVKIRPVQARALVASYEEQNPVAWALLSKEMSSFNFPNGGEYNAGYGTLFEVFVSERHRRKGIASAILTRARIVIGKQKICIAPHDFVSDSLFRKFQQNKKFDLKVI